MHLKETFIKKSPACDIQTLANALLDIFNADNKIEIIGPRHGEKLYESLISREEMYKALDLKDYFLFHLIQKILIFKIFEEGNKEISSLEDYTSHNTNQLNLEEVKTKLLELPYVKKCLKKN